MCRKMISLVSLVLLLGLSSTALATTYYVSPSGNDNNSGASPTDAWQTIDKVNSVTFSAGDSILFEGGQTFTGNLVFTSGGTPTSPITVSSYGSGRATLSNPTMDTKGLTISDCGGFEINDLILVGPGNVGDSWHDNIGIHLAATNANQQYIHIDNVEISNYSGYGVFIQGSEPIGFTDIDITNSQFHGIGKEAICSDGGKWPVSTATFHDIYVGDCVMYNITGTGVRTPHSGSGINFMGVDGGLIEFCEGYDSGGLCDAEGGGPLAMWCWECENMLFQFNEGHHWQTSGGDGGGFDLDGGTSFSTMQYNYSHDNFGGDLIMQFSRSRYAGDNIYRYNVNTNQGQFNSMGGVTFYSDAKLENIEVYNNTIYVGPDAKESSSAIAIWVWHGQFANINIRNNILVAEPGKRIVLYQTLDGFTFQNNAYWQRGAPLRIEQEDGPIYDTLDAWRSATGQEMLDSTPVGYEFDPKLVDVSAHPVVHPHNWANLTGYKLTSNSPCIDRGLNLQTLFGIDPGTQDFYGSSIPQGSAYDIGANEELGGGQVPIPDPPPPDSTPPSPDPMTFATAPYSTGYSSVAMVATTASDTSGVQYYFTCTAGNGHDSGWQNEASYEDTGIAPGTTFTYTVKARDISKNLNETADSSGQSATTDSYPGSIIFSDGFENGWEGGGWDVNPDTPTKHYNYISNSAAYEGSKGAVICKNGWVRKYISTAGYTDIRVKYAVRLVDGTCIMRWWDGSKVNFIDKISGNSDWMIYDLVLGPGADNNPDFYLQLINRTVHPALQTHVDAVEIWGVGGVPDTEPPTPDPMTWATVPYATGSSSIAMVATTASDPSGVEYYFDCTTTGGHDSGWQDNTSYTDTGLDPDTQYCYQVQARDKSPNQNATGWSTTECATTEAEAPPDTTPPTPDPMTWATVPYATGSTSIAMVATTATDASGVEYYFDCTTTGGHDSGWQASTSYEDTGLDPSTQYCYKVQARDKSPNQNAAGWSTTECATTQEPGADIYVYDIAMSWYEPKGGYYAAKATVWIKDVSLNDISGATVTGEWSGATTSGDTSGDTGVDGKITIESDDVKGGGTYTFCVTNVTATGYTYNSSLNNETCDSITAPEADTTPPSPDPMTWATVPYATGSSSIAMVATTASDPSGVEYYFDCTTTGGHDSGWQSSTSYEDTGLSPETTYTYQVKARDKSANQNETGWSTQKSATTEPEAPPDTTPPSPDPMTWATVPYATGSSSIAMVATTATDASGVEYYFDCLTTGGHDSAWQGSTSYEDTGLSCETSYSYRVQARDKSPNQNATGWSATESATTGTCGVPGQVFWDGFESGGFTEGGWTTGDVAGVQDKGADAYEGTKVVYMKLGGYIEKALSTVGYNDIHLKYARWCNRLSLPESLLVEWYDGSSWQVVEQGTGYGGSWVAKDWALPAGAANNANFKIRFKVDANGNIEWAWVDAVEVTGTQ